MFLILLGILLLTSTSNEGKAEKISDRMKPNKHTTGYLVRRQGYPFKEYINVTTIDGYQLILHRIPSGKKNSKQKNKPVVLLMHGLLCSSADWVNMGAEKSLAYVLADRGYDVWMGNARGNRYSRLHAYLNADQHSRYWQFSWHEIGIFDLPRTIDFILKHTIHKQIYYIGHSQGTTSFFVMASEKPQYVKKIKVMAALAPIAYMKHIQNTFFNVIAPIHGILDGGTKYIGLDEFLPHREIFSLIGQIVCNDLSIIQEICANVIFLIAGWDSNQLNRTKIPEIMWTTPAGASTRQVLHYGQLVQSGMFRQYDYGLLVNPLMYKSYYPPAYNLSKVEVPVGIFYASNDKLSAVMDVMKLSANLPNLVKLYKVPNKKFNHLDFLYGNQAKGLVYRQVLKLFKKYPMNK